MTPSQPNMNISWLHLRFFTNIRVSLIYQIPTLHCCKFLTSDAILKSCKIYIVLLFKDSDVWLSQFFLTNIFSEWGKLSINLIQHCLYVAVISYKYVAAISDGKRPASLKKKQIISEPKLQLLNQSMKSWSMDMTKTIMTSTHIIQKLWMPIKTLFMTQHVL